MTATARSTKRQQPRPPQEPTAPEKEPQELFETRAAISRMAQALEEQHGVHLDVGLINTTAQANAACQMFVRLGLCAPEQMDALILAQVKAQMAQILQAVEQAKLAAQKQAQGLQVVERPKLLVAKH